MSIHIVITMIIIKKQSDFKTRLSVKTLLAIIQDFLCRCASLGGNTVKLVHYVKLFLCLIQDFDSIDFLSY